MLKVMLPISLYIQMVKRESSADENGGPLAKKKSQPAPTVKVSIYEKYVFSILAIENSKKEKKENQKSTQQVY